jgi:hypothetical protein
MLDLIQGANLLARFLLEIAMLAVLTVTAFRSRQGMWPRLLAAAATFVGVTLVWALVVHGSLPSAVRVGTQVVLFGAAGLALVGARRRAAAAAFVGVVLLNAGLMVVWGQ